MVITRRAGLRARASPVRRGARSAARPPRRAAPAAASPSGHAGRRLQPRRPHLVSIPRRLVVAARREATQDAACHVAPQLFRFGEDRIGLWHIASAALVDRAIERVAQRALRRLGDEAIQRRRRASGSSPLKSDPTSRSFPRISGAPAAIPIRHSKSTKSCAVCGGRPGWRGGRLAGWVVATPSRCRARFAPRCSIRGWRAWFRHR
jgi:hypothetical protein